MLKPQIVKKSEIVEELQTKAAKAQIGILADFSGLPVEAMNQLRRLVKEADGEVKVAKNTLLGRAADHPGSLLAPLAPHFTGPNALMLGYADPVALAKILVKFTQERPQLQIKAGALGTQTLSPKDIEALAKLPSREVLLAQLLGVLQGVPQALVNVLAGVIRNFLNVLVAIRDQKEQATVAGSREP